MCCIHLIIILFLGSSDFEPLIPIVFVNNTEVYISTISDRRTLEYNENILLTFTPDDPALIPVGQYIRDTAIVNIIDDDSKCSLFVTVGCTYYSDLCNSS